MCLQLSRNYVRTTGLLVVICTGLKQFPNRNNLPIISDGNNKREFGVPCLPVTTKREKSKDISMQKIVLAAALTLGSRRRTLQLVLPPTLLTLATTYMFSSKFQTSGICLQGAAATTWLVN